MAKAKIEVTLNGFHGYATNTVVADIQKDPNFTGDKELDYLGLSKKDLELKSIEIRGNYPQN